MGEHARQGDGVCSNINETSWKVCKCELETTACCDVVLGIWCWPSCIYLMCLLPGRILEIRCDLWCGAGRGLRTSLMSVIKSNDDWIFADWLTLRVAIANWIGKRLSHSCLWCCVGHVLFPWGTCWHRSSFCKSGVTFAAHGQGRRVGPMLVFIISTITDDSLVSSVWSQVCCESVLFRCFYHGPNGVLVDILTHSATQVLLLCGAWSRTECSSEVSHDVHVNMHAQRSCVHFMALMLACSFDPCLGFSQL